MDPTVKAIYLQRIIHWLLHDVIRFEDGERVRSILSRFHADKHRLPLDRRDIGLYDTPGDIAALLDPEDALVVRDVPPHILDDCDILAKGPEWALFSVRTEEAAIWWSDSTDWCTRHRDRAEDYIAAGPLHVVVSNGKKFQYHWPTGQAMDRRDRPLDDLEDFDSDLLEAVLLSAVAERQETTRSYVECPNFEALVVEALRSRGRDAPVRVRGWLSADGARAIAHDYSRFENRRLEGPRYRTFVAHENGVAATLDRGSFEDPTTIPPFVLDFLRSDHDERSGWRSRIGTRDLGEIGEDFVYMWHATDGQGDHTLFEGWAVVSGRRHMVWLWNEAVELGHERPANICVLDVDEPSMHVLRSRQDLTEAPMSIRRAIADVGRHAAHLPDSSAPFVRHYGRDALEGSAWLRLASLAEALLRTLFRRR